jgi:hypothetical protein
LRDNLSHVRESRTFDGVLRPSQTFVLLARRLLPSHGNLPKTTARSTGTETAAAIVPTIAETVLQPT